MPSFPLQLRQCCTAAAAQPNREVFVRVCDTGFSVADGAQSVVVLPVLADDPPLTEHGAGADGAHVERAPRSKQVVSADVALVASDGEVPVRKGKSGLTQHVLPSYHIKHSHKALFLLLIRYFTIFFLFLCLFYFLPASHFLKRKKYPLCFLLVTFHFYFISPYAFCLPFCPKPCLFTYSHAYLSPVAANENGAR